MSGHHSFDHAAQMGNLWLRKLEERLPLEAPSQSVTALRVVLHALRDRLTPEAAVHLSAQLPLVIRGLFYEGWKPSQTPSADDDIETFCAHIGMGLTPGFPSDPRSVASAVFDLLWEELDVGETAKVIDLLPHSLRVLWPPIARRG